MVEMPFFRLNMIHDYNIGMNAIDFADQIRNTYRWDFIYAQEEVVVVNNDVVFTDATC